MADDSLVLITGGAGFIGSNLAAHYAGLGRRVVVCDRMRRGGKWRNLVAVSLHDLITPDSLPDWLARHGGGVGLVLHMGAISTTTETDIDRIQRDNIRATLDLWEWCATARVPFIYASSAATYGNGGQGFSDDDDPAALDRLRPLNAYGWSKLLADRRIARDRRDGRPTPPAWAGLRFFNVYGPGENHKGDMRSVINKIIPVLRGGETVRLFRSYRDDYADGAQMRDFVYVQDVVGAIAFLAACPDIAGIFNVGAGVARSWNDLVAATARALSVMPRIDYIDMPRELRDHYQYFTQAPLQRIEALGWAPRFSLEAGIEAYVRAAVV